jgi:hypothetical protein
MSSNKVPQSGISPLAALVAGLGAVLGVTSVEVKAADPAPGTAPTSQVDATALQSKVVPTSTQVNTTASQSKFAPVPGATQVNTNAVQSKVNPNPVQVNSAASQNKIVPAQPVQTFTPAPNNSVTVGFQNGQPRAPVVTGGVNTATQPPPVNNAPRPPTAAPVPPHPVGTRSVPAGTPASPAAAPTDKSNSTAPPKP